MNSETKTIRYGDISVYYRDHLRGGGMEFGQQYRPVIQKLFGPLDRIHECCAGPGFIGFSLLAHGHCRSLCLSDINPEAVELLQHTIAKNGLSSRVSAYLSDGLSSIPDHERWDLIVSNPPHFQRTLPYGRQNRRNLIALDLNLQFHRGLFARAGRHLTPHGSVLLQENHERAEGAIKENGARIGFEGTEPADLIPLLQGTGLSYVRSFAYHTADEPLWSGPHTHPDWAGKPNYGRNPFYFFWAKPDMSAFVSADDRPEVVLVDLLSPGDPLVLHEERRYRFKYLNHSENDIQFAFPLELHPSPPFNPGGWCAYSHFWVPGQSSMDSGPCLLYPGQYTLQVLAPEGVRPNIVRVLPRGSARA